MASLATVGYYNPATVGQYILALLVDTVSLSSYYWRVQLSYCWTVQFSYCWFILSHCLAMAGQYSLATVGQHSLATVGQNSLALLVDTVLLSS